MGKSEEVWKDIDGYEGLYQVSSYGRVRSLHRKGTDGRIISPSYSSSGYLQIHLCKNGIQKTYQIHRIVAAHFLENENNLPEVNHKDEVKTNNRAENLEYCTRIYNVRYGTAIQRMAEAHNYKESAKKSAMHHDYKEVARKQSKPVLQLDKNGTLIKRWDSLRQVSRVLGYSCGNISSACNGKIKSVYGCKWQFEETL